MLLRSDGEFTAYTLPSTRAASQVTALAEHLPAGQALVVISLDAGPVGVGGHVRVYESVADAP